MLVDTFSLFPPEAVVTYRLRPTSPTYFRFDEKYVKLFLERWEAQERRQRTWARRPTNFTNVATVVGSSAEQSEFRNHVRSMNHVPDSQLRGSDETLVRGDFNLLSAPVAKAIATHKTKITAANNKVSGSDKTALKSSNIENMEHVTKDEMKYGKRSKTKHLVRDRCRKRRNRVPSSANTGDETLSEETTDCEFSSDDMSSPKLEEKHRIPRQRALSESRTLSRNTINASRQEWNRKRRLWTKEIRRRVEDTKRESKSCPKSKRNWRDRLKVALACTAIAGASGGAVYTYLASCVNAEECGRAISQFAEQAWREINNVSG